MAPQKPREAEADSAHHAVTLDRFHHVLRAGRVKAARARQHGRDPSLIQTKRSRLRVRALGENLADLALDGRRNSASSNGLRGFKTIVQRGREFVQVQTYGLPHSPLHAIPNDGLADRLGDGEPDLGPSQARPAAQGRTPRSTGRRSGNPRHRLCGSRCGEESGRSLGNPNLGLATEMVSRVWRSGRCVRR